MNAKTLTKLEDAYDSFYAPTYEIDIDGSTTFSTAKGQASSVRVKTAIEKINRVTFSVAGVYDLAKRDFTGLEKVGLSVGNDLSVKVGYGSNTKPAMKGLITDVKPNFSANEAPTVTVVGHDYRFAMGQSTGDASWDKTTIPEAIQFIANKYGFDTVEVETGEGPNSRAVTEMELTRLVQNAESHLGFLTRLISKYDYEMFSRGGVLYLRHPTKGGDPTVSLTYGRGLQSYQRQNNSNKSSVTSIEYRGVNHYTGETISATSERIQGEDEKLLFNTPMESDEEAKHRSMSKQTEIERESTSILQTIGLPDLRIGEWVELTGLGSVGKQDYDGQYYLQSVNHYIDDSGYSTQAKVSGPITHKQ